MTIELKYNVGDKVVVQMDGTSYHFATITGYTITNAHYTDPAHKELAHYELSVPNSILDKNGKTINLPDRVTWARPDEISHNLARLKTQKDKHPDQPPAKWLWDMNIEDIDAKEKEAKPAAANSD